MSQTLLQMIESCEARTGFNDSNYRPKWRTFLNDALKDFARSSPWEGLEDLITVSTGSDQHLFLPHYVDSVISILNLTNSIPVEREGNWDRESPYVYSNHTTGRVVAWDRLGEVPVLKDPAGYVSLVSSHVSDAVIVTVTGYVANSGASGTALQTSFRREEITTTGTTPITLTTLFSKVVSISKATNTNGDFFFYDAGASLAHVGFIPQDKVASVFKRLHLLYKPSPQQLLEIRYRREVPELMSDDQAPDPAVKCDFLVEKAIASHFGEQQQHQKAALQDRQAFDLLEQEVNKDQNFTEPHSQIVPYRPMEDYDLDRRSW